MFCLQETSCPKPRAKFSSSLQTIGVPASSQSPHASLPSTRQSAPWVFSMHWCTHTHADVRATSSRSAPPPATPPTRYARSTAHNILLRPPPRPREFLAQEDTRAFSTMGTTRTAKAAPRCRPTTAASCSRTRIAASLTATASAPAPSLWSERRAARRPLLSPRSVARQFRQQILACHPLPDSVDTEQQPVANRSSSMFPSNVTRARNWYQNLCVSCGMGWTHHQSGHTESETVATDVQADTLVDGTPSSGRATGDIPLVLMNTRAAQHTGARTARASDAVVNCAEEEEVVEVKAVETVTSARLKSGSRPLVVHNSHSQHREICFARSLPGAPPVHSRKLSWRDETAPVSGRPASPPGLESLARENSRRSGLSVLSDESVSGGTARRRAARPPRRPTASSRVSSWRTR